MTFSDESRQSQFPGMSRSDSRWLVKEVRRVLRAYGHRTRVLDGRALVATNGQTFGLDNLARTVAMLPRRHWRRAVAEQYAALLSLDSTKPPDPKDLRPKLMTRTDADQQLTYEPLEPLPGIVAAIAAQGNGATQTYGNLDIFGMKRDECFDQALSNLADLRLPRHVRRLVDTHSPTSWVEHFESSDACGAARVLLLPDLFRRVLRRDIPHTGVFVTIPTKHDLWVQIPVDESFIGTSLHLAHASFGRWSESPYPLSPDVYLVSPDMQGELILCPDREGVSANQDALARVINALPDLGETG